MEHAFPSVLASRTRNAPPALGAVITFRYQELSDGGVPRFPSYIGERIDHDPTVAPALKGATTVDPGRKPVPAAPLVPAAPSVAAPPSVPAAPSVAPPPSVPATEPAGGPTRKRLFEFRDATSQKFWEITRTGASFKVRYGKIGSGGQRTLKEFATDAQAETEAAKLIREKTSKGYREVL